MNRDDISKLLAMSPSEQSEFLDRERRARIYGLIDQAAEAQTKANNARREAMLDLMLEDESPFTPDDEKAATDLWMKMCQFLLDHKEWRRE